MSHLYIAFCHAYILMYLCWIYPLCCFLCLLAFLLAPLLISSERSPPHQNPLVTLRKPGTRKRTIMTEIEEDGDIPSTSTQQSPKRTLHSSGNSRGSTKVPNAQSHGNKGSSTSYASSSKGNTKGIACRNVFPSLQTSRTKGAWLCCECSVVICCMLFVTLKAFTSFCFVFCFFLLHPKCPLCDP